MAAGIQIVCDHCARSIEAWSDGNPYYIDEAGRKRYAYHPDHESLARCVGNDVPHLCLGCANQFNVDSRAPVEACPSCAAVKITPTWDLEGRVCPFCGEGTFHLDPERFAIS